MKLNKIKAIFPAIALFLTASMTSCMDDLEKGNIDPTVEPNPNLLGLYSKCYTGLIMEGNDGNADFTIDDAGKSTLLRNVFNLMNFLPMRLSAGGATVVLPISVITNVCRVLRLSDFFIIV